MITRKERMYHKMKGFFEWFKSNAKMKRWMLLILIGIALACFGFAQMLVLKELSFMEVIKIGVTFIIRIYLCDYWISLYAKKDIRANN